MKDLRTLNIYFRKYRGRLLLGLLFVFLSNYFGILAPQITGYVVDQVEIRMNDADGSPAETPPGKAFYDPLVETFIHLMDVSHRPFSSLVLWCGLLLLAVALLRGFFMFLMRQTLIVMSRHIEYDQKRELYDHYQRLDATFYKANRTGDLMSRISEDVSRVRMYTGPSIMYLTNLTVLIGFSLFYMFRENPQLTLYVLSPLPILAAAIYYVNNVINRRSERIQAQLSEITIHAQESYSGIRVIKSFGQEAAMSGFFRRHADDYRQSTLGLAMVEAVYFPSIGLLIGLSTLLTIFMGGIYQLDHEVSSGTIAEFVVYINMLTFPVSAIGWVASMIQRAAASQKRIMAIIGKTGSGKSTIAQLLLRHVDPTSGSVRIDGTDLRQLKLSDIRDGISYVPQDTFLFSASIAQNIRFGDPEADDEKIRNAARRAAIDVEIEAFPDGYATRVGERGVNLSGGQKQRISIARALCRQAPVLIFDDCLSAVDAATEHRILSGMPHASGTLRSDLSQTTRTLITLTLSLSSQKKQKNSFFCTICELS
ncbi:MAG: ABC transporter ATP-binding protein/permease [Chitinophagaceae bacterium]|nr:ABC transporter ATP-binding protein/permease [Chitinophagaceae bacterium]